MTQILTKYECARIIGIRAAQIAMSAPILIDVPVAKQSNFMYIAALELKNGLLDIFVRRPLPMNKFYEVSVSDMIVPDDVDTLIEMYAGPAGR